MNQRTSSRQHHQQSIRRPISRRGVAPARPRSRPFIRPWAPSSLTAVMLAPLRLFLGLTFVYAGIQKLTDPQYFSPGAPGYIGRQITTFATGSPIRGLLIHIAAPHAVAFGALVAWGELAIGVGALLGLLLRPAAFFGALLSLLFFLSASWRVRPYFYGSDIVFLFAWLTLMVAGPVAGGWFALDTRLFAWLAERVPAQYSERYQLVTSLLVGVHPPTVDMPVAQATAPVRSGRSGRQPVRTRRDFVRGAFAGVATTMGAWLAITLIGKGSADGGQSPMVAPTATAGVGDTATATSTGSAGATQIATVSQVSANSSANFTLASNGDPGVLVRLSSGSFVAYDASCTHAGCPVQYDPSTKLLLCPCHGAAFDPAQSAAVVQGPADTPLASVPIHVDATTGAITTNS